MEPINYLPTQQVNPLQNLVSGLQAGAMLSQLKAQSDAQQLQEQYKADMSDYWNNPSADKLMQMQVKYPQQAEAFKPLIAQMDKNQLIAEQSTGTQVINAIKSNDMETANKILDQAITSGKDQGINTNVFQQVKNNLGTDPKGALAQAQLILFHSMTPEQQEKWASAQAKMEETRQSQELFPSKKTEQEAKAKTAGFETTIKEAEAKIAPQKVEADLRKTIAEAKKFELEPEFERQRIALEKQRIAVSRESNSIEREKKQIELMKMTNDLSDKINEKKAAVQSASDNALNIKQTVQQALKYYSPKTKDWKGQTAADRAHGTIASRIFTVDQDTADYEEKLKTIGSQAFLAMVPALKGTGNLSEKEGDKIQAAMQSLALTQSSKEARKALLTIDALSQKALKTAETKYGIKGQEVKQSQRGDMSNKQIANTLGI